MKTEHLYLWRHLNPWGKTVTTRYRCTEAEIRVEHPDAIAVEGSLEVRHIPETPEEVRAVHDANSAHWAQYGGEKKPGPP